MDFGVLVFWLLVLTIVAAIGAGIGWVRGRSRVACRAGAQEIYRDLTNMFSGEHEFRVLAAGETLDVDEAPYRRAQAFLSGQGFNFLGSLEDVTVSRAKPAHRTRIDCFSGDAGEIGAVVYSLGGHDVMDLGTVLDGPRFLITTNAEVDQLTPPPAFDKRTVPAATPPGSMLTLHRDRLAAMRRKNLALEVLAQRNLEDFCVASRASSRMVSDYRREIGFLTQDELTALAGLAGRSGIAKTVWREFVEIRDEAKRAA